MNTLISILLTILNNITTDNINREIIRQILLSYHDFEHMKASELAKRSFCNASAVNRFCKSLGFSSFNDLKAFMVSSHSVRISQIEHHMEITDEEELIRRISLYNREFDIIRFRKECDAVNALIQKTPWAAVIGAVFPEALTFQYQEDMTEMGKCIYSAPLARKLEVPSDNPEALIILVTFTGRLITYCQNEYAEICRKYPNIVLITGNEEIKSDSENHLILHLPFGDDNETANAAFVEVMRYLKYRYYVNYCR